MKKAIKALSLVSLVGTVVSVTGCGERAVSFQNDVRPILATNCSECHQEGGSGFDASGLSVVSYEALMAGTKPQNGEQRGEIIIPGDPASSTLMVLVEGRADPSIRMPHGKEPLKPEDINVLRTWIEQGAKNN